MKLRKPSLLVICFFIIGNIAAFGLNGTTDPLGPTGSITATPNNSDVCTGATICYSINPVTNATDYEWSIPANGTIVSGGGTSDTNVCVEYNSAGGGVLRVTPSNTCFTGVPAVLPVVVNSIVVPPNTPETICPNDFPITRDGNTFNGPGTYPVTYQSQLGCDSTVTYIFIPATQIPNFVSDTLNPGECFQVGDTCVTQSGTYELDGQYAQANGCDSIVMLSLFYNTVNCRQSDSLSLVSLYNSTDGANWTTTWDLNSSMDTWNGVTLNSNGCVNELQLNTNNLSGNLPQEIGQLSELQFLFMRGNNLTGTLPSQIGDLDSLKQLYLDVNSLSGNLPTEIGNLTELQLCRLDRNDFSGTIPTSLGNLKKLVGLKLHQNNFTGTIPIELTTLPLLSDLSLRSNQLEGTIPTQIGNLTELQFLFLASNNLTGSLPTEIGNLTKLERLDIFENNLTGELPASIGNLTMLEGFYAYDNDFSGCFPTELSFLCPLGFSSNLNNNGYNLKLNPKLPWEGDFERSCNGELQEGATCDDGDLNTQNDVIQADCSCQGTPSTCNPTSDSLELVRIYNNLSGPNWTNGQNNNWLSNQPFNSWEGVITNADGCVERLILDAGNLTGDMIDIQLPELKIFNVSLNQITGSIPDFSGMPILEELFLSANTMSGDVPDFSNLPLLQKLHFHTNNIAGNIPDFSALPSVRELSFFNNDLPDLPRFSNFINSGQDFNLIEVEGNALTFEDILPLNELNFISTTNDFSYAPQDSFYTATNFNVQEGDPLIIDLGIDADITTNIYTWYKDGAFNSTETTNQLSFPSIQVADAGVYRCDVTNPNAPDLTLYSRNVIVNVTPVALTCRQTDSLALVALYNSTDGANWTNTWDLNQPMDTWYGVTLNGDGCVECLDLDGNFSCSLFSDSGNNLVGTLPPDIGNLSNLRVLSLKYNQINGTLPSELGNLTNLISFSIIENQLTGSIPNELGNLTNLEVLNLSSNQLSGNIPIELANLTNLRILFLALNQLGGNIPAELTNLTNLEQLNLWDNQLSGSIPVELGDLANLTHLQLFSNQLVGNIPIELGNLSNLTRLWLNDNQLSGCFPNEINIHCDSEYNFTNNPSLPWSGDFERFCNGEQQEGAPCDDGDPNTQNDVIQPDCSCQGVILSTCRSADSTVLALIYNNTGGGSWNIQWDLSQPMNFWNGVVLNTDGCVEQLSLPNNNLTGDLPTEIGQLSELTNLSLVGNNLTGQVPAELGDLQKITSITIGKNQWSGTVPTNLFNAPLLDFLNIDDSDIDSLPPITSTNIQNFWINGNALTFDDVLPYTTLGLNVFIYFSQDSFYTATTFNVQENDPLTIDLGIDAGITTNIYNWYKDGNFDRTESTNQLTFPSIGTGDAGVYHCEVTNPNAPDLTLYSRDITINVTPTGPHCRQQDSLALVALYNATAGSTWATPWNLSLDMTTWDGVGLTADGCAIQDLNLNGRGLNGTLPVELGSLSDLRLLELDNNPNLTGGIPDEMGNLSNLIFLKINDCGITGNIPSALGNLALLEELSLGNNNLTGSIPSQLGQLANLINLQLRFNNLSGDIPPELGDMTNLVNMHLQDNGGITGSIPTTFQNLTNIEVLNLGGNDLSGQIPAAIGNITSLRYLFLGANRFSGEIPVELANLTNLIWLRVHDNDLNGCFDEALRSLCGLGPQNLAANTGYDFANNPLLPWQGDFEPFCNNETQIGAPCDDGDPNTQNDVIQADCSCQGTIINPCRQQDSLALIALYNSTDGANWTNTWDLAQPIDTWYGVTLNTDGCVSQIGLSNNNLSGALPPLNFPNATIFSVSENQLSGSIPELNNMASLVQFSCFDNQLTGSIPNLDNVPALSDFWCHRNQLTGSIPDLDNVPFLRWFTCGQNNLSGSIPTLNNVPQLEQFLASENQLTGSIPNLDNVPELRRFYCGINSLTGGIPDLSNVPNLEWFYCNENQLTGGLPDFNGLSRLVRFVCYNNQLSGSIPSSLSDASNLTHFFAHDNNLDNCYLNELSFLCGLGFTTDVAQSGYNLTGNPLLPWSGDFERFCNGEQQDGASCDDGDPNTMDDVIQADCSCSGVVCTPNITTENSTICPEDNLVVNGQVYDINNSQGQEMFLLQNGCDSTVNVDLQFHAQAISSLNDVFCEGSDYVLPDGVRVSASGNYTTILADQSINGCDSTINVTLTMEGASTLGAADAGNDATVCDDMVDLFATELPNTTGSWISPTGSSVQPQNQGGAVASNLQTGANEFIWTLSSSNCADFDSDTVIINYNNQTPDLRPDRIGLRESGVYQLDLLSNDNLNGITDFTIDFLNVPTELGVIDYNATTQLVTIEPPQNISSTFTFEYEICQTSCPDLCDSVEVNFTIISDFPDEGETNIIITPLNNDNKNDKLIFDNLDMYPNNNLYIYNRWGNVVYSAAPYKNDWDGSRRGKQLPEGTYYYVMRKQLPDKIQYGSVTIKY